MADRYFVFAWADDCGPDADCPYPMSEFQYSPTEEIILSKYKQLEDKVENGIRIGAMMYKNRLSIHSCGLLNSADALACIEKHFKEHPNL